MNVKVIKYEDSKHKTALVWSVSCEESLCNFLIVFCALLLNLMLQFANFSIVTKVAKFRIAPFCLAYLH